MDPQATSRFCKESCCVMRITQLSSSAPYRFSLRALGACTHYLYAILTCSCAQSEAAYLVTDVAMLLTAVRGCHGRIRMSLSSRGSHLKAIYGIEVAKEAEDKVLGTVNDRPRETKKCDPFCLA